MPCLAESREDEDRSPDLSEVLAMAEGQAPQLVLVLDMNREARVTLGLARSQVFDLTRDDVAGIMTVIIPRFDQVSSICIQELRSASLPISGECLPARSIDWSRLHRKRSYKVVVRGNEYESRKFFSNSPVRSLKLLDAITFDQSPGHQDLMFEVTNSDGSDAFFVRPGDRIGEEQYDIVGEAHGCMLLRGGDATLRICRYPPG